MVEMTEEGAIPPSPARPHPAGRRLIGLIVVLALLGTLLGVLAWGLQPRTSATLLGQPAPPFEITAINGEFAGQRFALADLRGHVVVLNIWASWCIECAREASVLEQAWRAYRPRGVWFIGVDYLDTDTAGLAYLKRFDITYPNGPDIGSRIYQAYRATGVPETFFIDRDGIIRHVQIGPIGRAQLDMLLERLLTPGVSQP
ncbi:MAG: TlpA family protein disulfide reductase [Anaerolineae bacterium]|nr:TlpA family protein disulfide reductase [Anaerolineae bacterium]MDW8071527.1 TlpA disulfide reductase family protein [Anaerolineae bacterium]